MGQRQAKGESTVDLWEVAYWTIEGWGSDFVHAQSAGEARVLFRDIWRREQGERPVSISGVWPWTQEHLDAENLFKATGE